MFVLALFKCADVASALSWNVGCSLRLALNFGAGPNNHEIVSLPLNSLVSGTLGLPRLDKEVDGA